MNNKKTENNATAHQSGAANCYDCEGCQHRQLAASGNWCYMFENAPQKLPCGQHDKYKIERQITGELISKYPILLYGMILQLDPQA